MDFLDFDDSSSEESDLEVQKYGGAIQNGVYTVFETPKDASIFLQTLVKELSLASSEKFKVGDVHKVADFGVHLKKKSEREEWIAFVREHFKFLISYISEDRGRLFDGLLSLSKELNLTILVSLQRGSGFDEGEFHEFGSKAWYLREIHTLIGTNPVIEFYDDSDDHVDSINSLGIPTIKGKLVDYTDDRGKNLYSKYTYLERMDAIEDAF